MMIPGAWAPRRALSYIPASQAGSISSVRPAEAAVAPLLSAVVISAPLGTDRSATLNVAIWGSVMMVVTWLLLWGASLSTPLIR